MDGFHLNGIWWKVRFVNSSSEYLTDRTGNYRLATTDVRLHYIWIDAKLSGRLLVKVLLHELGHATMASYGLIDDLHRFVKKDYWVDAEEWICNLIADYGAMIFLSASNVLGDSIWDYIPKQIDSLLN